MVARLFVVPAVLVLVALQSYQAAHDEISAIDVLSVEAMRSDVDLQAKHSEVDVEAKRTTAAKVGSPGESLKDGFITAAAIQQTFVNEGQAMFDDMKALSVLIRAARKQKISGVDELAGPENPDWEPKSEHAQRFKEADYPVSKQREELDKVRVQWSTYASTGSHDTVEWMVALFEGGTPAPSNSVYSNNDDVAMSLLEDMKDDSNPTRMYAVRWANPTPDGSLMGAHSWIVLRVQSAPSAEPHVMVVQSNARSYKEKFSVGDWLQGDPGRLPEHAREAHAVYGGGKLISLAQYSEDLGKAENLKAFGLEKAQGRVIAWNVFTEFDFENIEKVEAAIVASKKFRNLESEGFFTQRHFEGIWAPNMEAEE